MPQDVNVTNQGNLPEERTEGVRNHHTTCRSHDRFSFRRIGGAVSGRMSGVVRHLGSIELAATSLRTGGPGFQMRSLFRWWSYPTDYAWTIAYLRADPFLRRAHLARGVCCWFFAGLCVLLTHSPAGITTNWGRALAYVMAGSLVFIGAWWIRTPAPSQTASRIFVVYLGVTAAVALLLLADPFVALPCAAALGVIGSYVAALHSPKLFLAYQGWAFLVVCTLFARAITAPGADVVLVFVYLIALILVLFSAPILAQFLLLLLRRDAANAYYDPLTGLRNRRGLDAAIADYSDSTSATSATVMVIDLDMFKLINDRFGHAHGDTVLRETAEMIHAAFPPPAITARIGGEEFAVVTPTDPANAVAHAHMLRERFATREVACPTVSIGIADSGARPLVAVFPSALGRADAAMYVAKGAGGNTVYIHDETPVTPDET